MPLNEEYFKNSSAYNEDMKFDNIGTGRSICISTNLEPSTYCIVPCTKRQNAEASFLLSVYATNHFHHSDTKISKNVPSEEPDPNKSDEGLKNVFNDVARGRDEVDWIGLKETLEAALNPSGSRFGMIASKH